MFLFSGSTLIGIAIGTQRRPPTPPPLVTATADPRQDVPTSAGSAPSTSEASWLAGVPVGQPSATRGREVEPAAPDYVALGPRTPDVEVSDADVGEAPGTSGFLLASSEPVSIDIPAIGVRSVVRHTGQAPDGSLEVPSGAQYDDAAWYRHSPTPGSLGPAVILGHVDSAARGPSVFFRLGELQQGQRVTVNRADGSTAVFVVDAVHRYAKADFPTQLVYSDIDHAGLRILTCGGAFDRAARSYVDNIVVFASLIDGGT